MCVAIDLIALKATVAGATADAAENTPPPGNHWDDVLEAVAPHTRHCWDEIPAIPSSCTNGRRSATELPPVVREVE